MCKLSWFVFRRFLTRKTTFSSTLDVRPVTCDAAASRILPPCLVKGLDGRRSCASEREEGRKPRSFGAYRHQAQRRRSTSIAYCDLYDVAGDFDAGPLPVFGQCKLQRPRPWNGGRAARRQPLCVLDQTCSAYMERWLRLNRWRYAHHAVGLSLCSDVKAESRSE